VAVELHGGFGAVSLPIRTTVYRLLQETLANGYRHAQGAGQRVVVREEDGEIDVEVADRGPGFDEGIIAGRAQGGLAGMRERVQALGGTFQVSSVRGEGTCVHVTLPASVAGDGDE
jgi:signal transduction histidine kinase